jgi:UPF0755 protein
MRFFRQTFYVLVSLMIAGAFALIIRSIPPDNFPKGKIVSIPSDATLSSAANVLAKERVIRSAFFYKVFVVLLGGEKDVKMGDYYFAQPESALKIASRTIQGETGISRAKITIPEGSSSKDIAKIIRKNIPGFDFERFVAIAKEHEGYLFPDTYFFYENVTPEAVVQELRANFDKKIATLEGDLASSTVSIKDLIIMSSIVEREGISDEDRKIIAGILWKRLKAGMALQVDATFFYLLGKPSSQLTVDDLKMKSPYNTYTNAGLPPGPIANPGIQAISDTLNAVKTPYWYYLTGKDGKMYYAVDLEGHVANKRNHL